MEACCTEDALELAAAVDGDWVVRRDAGGKKCVQMYVPKD